MIKKNQKYLHWLNRLSDLALLYIAYLLAAWLWLGVVRHNPANIAWDYAQHRQLLLVLLFALFVSAFQYFGLYDSFRSQSTVKELVKLSQVYAFCCAGALGLVFLFKVPDFSRGVAAVFMLLGFALLALKRICLRRFLRNIRAGGYNQKHVLLVGSGRLAEKYMAAIAANPEFGFRCIGYVADGENHTLGNRLGDYSQLRAILKKCNPDEIVVALEQKESSEIGRIINDCEAQGTRTSIIPTYNDYLVGCATMETLEDVRLVNIRAIPLDLNINRVIKRSFDILFSAFVLLVFSPLFLFLILGVRLSSPGPIFFKQKRVGKNNREFYMYKFRSMRVNDSSDTAWSTARDSRITPFGAFIRKFSLDELPQFWNVLIGDMSVIGPRPELPHFVEIYSETIPRYRVKHQVQPGITGLAQVNGYRGDTSIEKRIEFDLRYIENWSVFLDIKIILMTVFGGMMNEEKNIDAMLKKKEKK